MSGTWEQRWHPLRLEWVVVAAHRQNRPWLGQTVTSPAPDVPTRDLSCYLCPGNGRISGLVNPPYSGVYVFDNDHPCVGPDAPETPSLPPPPYQVLPATGRARVICYSPRHDLTLAEMSTDQIAQIVEVWKEETRVLTGQPGVKHVLIFENKGDVVGVSNPHPHGQIYATNFVFKTMETELDALARHRTDTGRPLFDDILHAEQEDGRRVLFQDDRVIAFVPYFARYSYEVYVVPRRRVSHVDLLDDAESVSLAAALKDVTVRFDNLWRLSFPYVMVLHQAPTDARGADLFHFYISFHPPLRQPALLKFLAGPEIGGGNFLSDTAPEAKAAELRAVPPIHHRHVGTP